jgi:hypothetical protein
LTSLTAATFHLLEAVFVMLPDPDTGEVSRSRDASNHVADEAKFSRAFIPPCAHVVLAALGPAQRIAGGTLAASSVSGL